MEVVRKAKGWEFENTQVIDAKKHVWVSLVKENGQQFFVVAHEYDTVRIELDKVRALEHWLQHIPS